MTWTAHGFDSFFTPPGSDAVLATVHFSHDQWVWEAHAPEDLGLDMDGWWGRKPTEKEAQEAAEAYLRKYRVPVT